MSTARKTYTIAESRAFVEVMEIEPYASGPLDGLRFAVKDLIDVGGYKTGCGNPDWARTHSVAAVNAVCVDQLLLAGARCVGKAVCDELAFSLDGENVFFGTPLNPRAPERVPGGSSSGSAAAVACGLADFALGTDTGGSVRVPASNCGLFGIRPSHGRISVAGVMPFAPTFDTVGLLAASAEILVRAAAVLFSCQVPVRVEPTAVYLVQEAWETADREVREALAPSLERLRSLWGLKVKEASIRPIDEAAPENGLQNWFDTYCTIQWAEIWSSLGGWIQAVKPEFGPRTKVNFELTRTLDRSKVPSAIRQREEYCRRLQHFLAPEGLLCLPTTPALAPLKLTLGENRTQGGYYPRTLSLTAIAGLGRLPQVTLPLAEVGGVPIGLSLLAAHGNDAFLLRAAQMLAERL
ncbi:MAG: amidase [Deltaproteobacteria bacterium]|nr:amidase [Deltaproteobacteria bacterium]